MSGERVAVIIQARMGSSRLPGKVARNLCGRSMLEQVVRRVQCARTPHVVAIATSRAPGDDIIVDLARAAGAECVRGSEDDVLARYKDAADACRADVVVRVTADCPLIDPDVLDAVVEAYGDTPAVDYCSNILERTYPRGLDVEAFSASALARWDAEYRDRPYREHVTLPVLHYPGRFRTRNVASPVDLSSYRWTVDVEDDWRLIVEIYEMLDRADRAFSTEEILGLLDRRPELLEFNREEKERDEAVKRALDAPVSGKPVSK